METRQTLDQSQRVVVKKEKPQNISPIIDQQTLHHGHKPFKHGSNRHRDPRRSCAGAANVRNRFTGRGGSRGQPAKRRDGTAPDQGCGSSTDYTTLACTLAVQAEVGYSGDTHRRGLSTHRKQHLPTRLLYHRHRDVLLLRHLRRHETAERNTEREEERVRLLGTETTVATFGETDTRADTHTNEAGTVRSWTEGRGQIRNGHNRP